jgi:alpha-L-rhamnosidase
MQINGVTKGESAVLAATDATWRHHPSPYVAVGMGSTFEYYDFRIPDPTLARESVSGPDWSPVTERSEKPTFARSIMPAERVIRRVTPVEMFSPAPGVYTFDMGEVITGNIEWKVPKDLPYGTRVIFRGSSYLQRDDADRGGTKGNIYYPQHIEFADISRQLAWYNALSSKDWKYLMPSVFYVAGENPPATWRTILDNRVFRYIEIIGLKHPPKPEDLTGLMIHTDLPAIGSFESSEPDFNRLHHMCINTFMMNTHGLLVDCWDQERKPYNGEWYKSQFARYVYDIDPPLRKHTLENVMETMDQGFCGKRAWTDRSRRGEEIVWAGSLVYMPQTAYLFGGDLQVMRESFDAIRKHVLHYRDTLGPDGLVRGNAEFGDWLNYRHNHVGGWLKNTSESIKKSYGAWNAPKREVSLLANAVICDMSAIAAGWGAKLGRKEESMELRQFHETLKASIHKGFFNAEERSYGRFPEIMPEGEDTLDAWALFTGIPPTEELRRDIIRKMVRELRERGHQFTTGMITSLAYFRLLSDYGYADDAYAVYTRKDWTSINYFMYNLCQPNSLFEWFHIQKRTQSKNGSSCHAGWAMLSDWFWYGLGGLRPDESHPGLKHFTLAPQIPGKMAWAKIAHESPYGKIISSWKRDGDRIRWEVTVPPNSTATALIPTTDVATIRESGKTVAQAGLTATAGPCETTRIELVPGAYVFEFQRKIQTSPVNP